MRKSAIETFRVRVDEAAELLAVAAREVAKERGARSLTHSDVTAGSERLLRAHDLLQHIRATLEQYVDEVGRLEEAGLRNLARDDDA